MSIPCSSFPNEICFIISGIVHPHAGENGATPGGGGKKSGLGGQRTEDFGCGAMLCIQRSLEVKVRELESGPAWGGRIRPAPIGATLSLPLLHLD
jgi:hypothetical protein